MRYLWDYLEPDELHLLSILTNRPQLSVTLDGDIGEKLPTYVGICQGDCLSAVLFIFYLAHALKEEPDDRVSRDLKAYLDVFYADDLTYATTSEEHRTSTTPSCSGPIPAQKSRVNSVPGAIFSHLMFDIFFIISIIT